MTNISLSRLNGVLLLMILSVVVLYFGKPFFVPLFFAILLGMLLLPICNGLERKGVGRVGSSLFGVLIIITVIAGVVGIIAAQGTAVADDWPKMQQKGEQLIKDVQQYIDTQYGIRPVEQKNYVEKGMQKVSDSGGQVFKSVLSTFSGFMTGLILTLLYFFFLMWKREKYEEFILKLVEDQNRAEVKRELKEITKVSSRYLAGRLVSMAFLAIFYMIGFSIVGLPNGLLIALIAVIPTLIPYVGAFIGGFFPLAMVLVNGSSEMLIPVVAILVVAQVIDNNIIEPLAEGESLRISPIWTIIAIVIGELIWGVAGMILFIPMVAILRIICNHIPSLHPYGFLLNNEIESPVWVEKLKRAFRGKTRE